MQPLFTPVLNGWASWADVYQSIEAFSPLIHEICSRHSIQKDRIEPVTPGTNAVFKVGGTVIKIYAPNETGVPQNWNELIGLRHAESVGVHAPRIIAAGIIEDQYSFYYLITEFIKGRQAGDMLDGLSDDEKTAFAKQLKELTQLLNISCDRLHDPIIDNVKRNTRWDVFSEAFRNTVIHHAESLQNHDWVYVHGDITGENVLITESGEIRLIDFGDSHLAPFWYEWPPIVFELFQCDPFLVHSYYENEINSGRFLSLLSRAVMLHDFGGNFVMDMCVHTQTDPVSISNRASLEELIAKRLN